MECSEAGMSISNLTVKWAGKEYLIPDLPQHACVVDLKDAIFKKTGVHPERQKLVGMKCKGARSSCLRVF